jgi:signal transduction histidine kinase
MRSMPVSALSRYFSTHKKSRLIIAFSKQIPLLSIKPDSPTRSAQPFSNSHPNTKHFGQVISNLLSNAIKFTPSSGSVTIELSVIDDDHSPNISCARICVTDTGIGIAADFLPHVFERFRQARDSDAAKGMGWGWRSPVT